MSVLVTLMFLQNQYKSTETTNESSTKVYCDQNITQSLGMIGTKYPEKIRLDMCPLVTKSCCKLEDQLKIYEYWIDGREEDNLEARLNSHRDIYSDLYNKAIEVYQRATKTMILLHDRSVSNCKVLARRIVNFRIDTLAPILRQSLDHYHTFLNDSYKGFYCSVCDAKNTRFIDVKRRTFTLNEEFCRDIVYNSLHILLYLHAHFSKYLNLLSKFMTSCDHRGNFKKKIISSKYLFSTKADYHVMLGGCHEYRNDINWFDFCEPMCKKFNMVEFNNFFKPNVEKIRLYSRWMGHQLARHRAAEAKDVLLNGYMDKAKKDMAKKKKYDEDVEVFNNHANNSRLLTSKTSASSGSEPAKNCPPTEKKDETKNDTKDNKTEEEAEEKFDATDKAAEEQQKFDEQLADAMRPVERPTIFRSVQQSDILYGEFANDFRIEGFNPYATGKTSIIDQNVYTQVKQAVNLQRKQQVNYVVNKKKNQAIKWVKGEPYNSDEDDDESNVYIWNILSVLSLILIVIR